MLEAFIVSSLNELQDAESGLTEAKEVESQKTSEIAEMQKAVKSHR